MKPEMLSKICAQISVYFQKAYEANQINPGLRAFENGGFANVLGYHAKYYLAMAYFQLADGQIKLVEEKAKGMGKALTLCKITIARFDESKPFA